MSYSNIDVRELIEKVSSRFNVIDYYVQEGKSLEFRIENTADFKNAFERLVQEVKPYGFLVIMRKSDDRLLLYLIPNPKKAPNRPLVPLILLLATIVTVSIDGYFRSEAYPGLGTFAMVSLYTIGVLGIIGTHEFGHKIASNIHGLASSIPYFIPGLPGALPTFGAIITSSEPPTNKDSLFDLGISGPIAGLAVTCLVAFGGALTSISLPNAAIEDRISQGTLNRLEKIDGLNEYLLDLFVNLPQDSSVVLSPLTFASSLGFLITFLNLMPAWQLDGGHIARAVLNQRWHRVATFASIGVLFALGFQLMAIMILVLSIRSPEMRPLDDVSPLSKNRKLMFVTVWALAALIYVLAIRDNPFFFR